MAPGSVNLVLILDGNCGSIVVGQWVRTFWNLSTKRCLLLWFFFLMDYLDDCWPIIRYIDKSLSFWNICISICTIQRHLFSRLVRMCPKKRGGGNDSVIKLHWSLMQNVVSWNKQVLFPLNTGMLTTKWLTW